MVKYMLDNPVRIGINERRSAFGLAKTTFLLLWVVCFQMHLIASLIKGFVANMALDF